VRERKAEEFRALHEDEPFVIPNPWDAGSAKTLNAVPPLSTNHASGRSIRNVRSPATESSAAPKNDPWSDADLIHAVI
jgi:hypothetical protein